MKPGDIVVPRPSQYWGPDPWTGREMIVCAVRGQDALLAWPHEGPIHSSDEVVAVNALRVDVVREGPAERAFLAAWGRWVERLAGEVRRPRPDAWVRRKNERAAREILASGEGLLDPADLAYLSGLTVKALDKHDVPGRRVVEKRTVYVVSADLAAWIRAPKGKPARKRRAA